MLVFSRRAQRSMFSQAEGQPGAAGWLLQQNLRGDWRLAQAVASTTHLDAVHRLVGRPGVVLVGEGAAAPRPRAHRAGEEEDCPRHRRHADLRRHRRHREGDLRLGKLNRYLLKLPANLKKDEVGVLDKRLAALTVSRAPLPQGPMPQGAKMRNVQRTVRRRT